MKRILTLVLTVLLALPVAANAADLLIAQAANFTPAMQEIIPAFKKATGFEVQATYTSTGKLYAQITNGAPFDVFLAADEKRPKKLYAAGLSEKPFVYAKGKVVFWSLKKEIGSTPWHKAVINPDLHKIAIANIETAPYGTAAMKALQKVKLWEKVKPELVYAQSIAQAFQYAATGAADAGFCAYSSVFTTEGRKGTFTVVNEAPPVIQAACILNSSEHKDIAQKFVKFLASPEVKTIKNKYGYE
ncbi:molybdate ABC transporter substrate-binding protein [Maridesulfovibrio ferrireducens]|uniref:molybdate ABC transporter substrate-binding protein n=1 Tax=Maridesulfovibrio ferrireducens TaxID=246191 RepID=UPI001A2F3B0A|nr:molybdate ABC transporter substrate-binding protein [Maridesulfovibrio ferrireducens]MBI9112908.1 molybdate ABC transporter substrate-binding protein [Maridesulfovibrio ferrireducens]